MSMKALSPRPRVENPHTGVADREAVAEALVPVLADTYMLVVKTHACHWNVVGPLFHPIHELTEAHYRNLFEAADELAERIRALGRLAPANIAAMERASRVEETEEPGSAAEMVEALAADHERLAHRLHALIELAEGRRDWVTADLAIERSAFHEKALWMLRAIVAE